MAIACVYCGAEHDRAGQVRQCWLDHNGQEVAPVNGAAELGTDPGDQTPAKQPSSRPQPGRRSVAPRTATLLRIPSSGAVASAGPDALARHLVVEEGAAAPPPWDTAPRLTIDNTVMNEPSSALEQLRAAHHQRHRLVIELAAPFDDDPRSSTTTAPFELGPRFTFELDELFHLVWSNSLDHRTQQPTWGGLDRAIHAGATPVVVGPNDSPSDKPGDVVLADGTVVWLDGGPTSHQGLIDGLPVLPMVSIEHASFDVPITNASTADLATDQLAAVTHPGGSARIIAPAGSGKTRVLTERARHLLSQWNLPASAVSLVAFNKRAQEEMTDRTADLSSLSVRTLNAIGLAIVNGTPPFAPQPTRWRTIGELDVRDIISKLVSFPRRRNSDPVAPWIEALSLIRLGLLTPTEAEGRYDGEVTGLADVWPKYRAALEQRQAVDFDDQIYRALLVLLTQPEARRTAQLACRVMLVDEFQDLTPAHVLLIRLLAAPGGSVFGVGDDDQTIYGYNGADPGWLIEFDQLFPGAASHPLEVNYRCPSDIVDAVDRLLRHNKRRVVKTIRASSTDTDGWSIAASADPVAAASNAVATALAKGSQPGDVAVLTRVNALLAPVQVSLATAGIPVAGGVGTEFMSRTAVRSTLAWIRLATSGSGGPTRFNTDDVREAMLRPSRSFHPRISDWISEQGSIDDLTRLAERLNTEKDTDRLLEFVADISSLQAVVTNGGTTSDVVDALIESIGLAGAVGGLDAHRRGMNRAAQGDDLTAMQHLATQYDDPVQFGSWLRDRLEIQRSDDGVVLATVHRVKGQEWPHVIVHLAQADQYPHRLAEDVEEERRLFHVAITRARTHATIVTGANPSPFVAELTTEPSADHVVALHQPEPTAATKTKRAKKTEPAGGLDPAGEARYDALCQLRHELRDGKPAYVVFDNKTAAAIAATQPATPKALLNVPGIGPAKVEKYGDAILELLTRLDQG